MLWFTGTIQEAIAQAKAKKVIFMVYIAGDDDHSAKMGETINSSEVSTRLSEIGCVAIQLQMNSDTCRQFSQIYPVVLVPSTFFIGDNGVPLEIIGGDVSPQEFVGKVETVIQLQQRQSPGSVVPPKVTATASSDMSSAEESSTRIAPAQGAAPSPVDETTSSSATSIDEKLDRAKQLIVQQKMQKAKLEMEVALSEEKRKEMERRQVGQDVQKLKLKQKETEAKALADALAKERAEERAARERVKQQIEQDRADRAARYKTEQSELERKQQEMKQAAAQAQQERAAADAAARSNTARLQFRFPDGSSITEQFPSDETLSTVCDYIRKNSRPPMSAFTLSTTFPRREFTQTDYPRTLRELQLAPCSAVLVLPAQQSMVPTSAGTVSFFWTLMSPLLSVFSFLRGLLWGSPPIPAPARSTSSASPSEQAAQSREDASKAPPPAEASASKSDRPQSAYKRRPGPSQTSFSRMDGNIHRFTNKDDEDDDNNTWNGNSTQQM